MSYLDTGRLTAIAGDATDFLERRPYPWLGMQGVVGEEGFRRLCAELPPLTLFEQEFGHSRGYGQQSHDRYALQYGPQLDDKLPVPWRDFIAELKGPDYAAFLRRMYGLGPNERFVLSMHWHFAASGGSVSPHTDARRKIGSHIFYLNTPEDWDPAWGGQTVVLDDGGTRPAHSAPGFDDMPQVAMSTILGNQSFMFKRTEHSWHAVRPISCPPGSLRKVFIVVINKVNLQVIWRRIRGKDPDGYRLRA